MKSGYILASLWVEVPHFRKAGKMGVPGNKTRY